ncbi:hypothetical protein [Flavobacterium silvaticum]|uniref:Uncharacterized protein n=1 Tax=Flavobacterium silvaticum TaxID=1852020 RepID=A0A972JIW2_9FLAO|nr:hypothetical protein [Flavobacterium silvaticum]NMH29475.1 hypothetical protein [Flavobacterium silvaticum]
MDLNFINTFCQRLNLRLQPVVLVLSVLYVVLMALVFLSRPAHGDEFIFIGDLQFVMDNGFWAASASQVSLPQMLLAYPLALLFSPLVALRTINVLIMLFLLYYIVRIRKLNTDVVIYFLFYFGTAHFFFSGISDVLFIAGMVVFFTETMLYLDDTKDSNLNWGFLGLIVAFFTREIVLFYLLAVILGCYLVYSTGWRPRLKKSIPHLFLITFFVVLNIPGMLRNGKLSYDDRVPETVKNANMWQLRYLSRIMIDQGFIADYTYADWDEVLYYMEENGQQSLPSDALGTLVTNPELTIIEFFQNLADSVFFSVHAIGFMMLFCFFYFMRGYFFGNEGLFGLFVPMSFAFVMILVSLIAISFIESRWYASILLPVTIFFSEQARREKYSHSFLTANFATLCLMMLYGMFILQ